MRSGYIGPALNAQLRYADQYAYGWATVTIDREIVAGRAYRLVVDRATINPVNVSANAYFGHPLRCLSTTAVGRVKVIPLLALLSLTKVSFCAIFIGRLCGLRCCKNRVL